MAALKLALSVDSGNPNKGDLYLTPTGKTRMCADLSEEVAQLLYTRLLFFKGEWALDPASGVPWIQQILGIKNTEANVAAILKRVILTTPGVARLTSFSMPVVDRRASPTFSVVLVNGATLRSSDFGPILL